MTTVDASTELGSAPSHRLFDREAPEEKMRVTPRCCGHRQSSTMPQAFRWIPATSLLEKRPVMFIVVPQA
jgi:hypothetical protein